MRQVRKIATVCVLSATEAGDILSNFEAELIREVARRFLDLGCGAVITAAEERTLDDLLEAMTRASWPTLEPEFRGGELVGVRPSAAVEVAA